MESFLIVIIACMTILSDVKIFYLQAYAGLHMQVIIILETHEWSSYAGLMRLPYFEASPNYPY